MGVQGLSGFLRTLGLDQQSSSNNSNNDSTTSSTTLTLPHNPPTTFVIDGNGLIFHLFRLAYRQHRQNVLQSFHSTNNSPFNNHGNKLQQCKILEAQLLLPSLTPLSLLHTTTSSYLLQLTSHYNAHLKIYFDGNQQYMKRLEKKRRGRGREEEWECVKQLCVNGMLPENSNSKFRSGAFRQARDYTQRQGNAASDAQDASVVRDGNNNNTNAGNESNRNNADGNNGYNEMLDEEFYLQHFPVSPLTTNQIERSIHSFVDNMSSILSAGSIQIVQCESEADAEVARSASVNAGSVDGMHGGSGGGSTFVLGNDSDYLIYGWNDDDNHIEEGDNDGNENTREARYLRFHQLTPSNSSNQSQLQITGPILTRSNIATAIGLPNSRAMIDLSILLGNDYTGPFFREEDVSKRREWRESVRWYQESNDEEDNVEGSGGDGEGSNGDGNDGERLPSEKELSRFNVQGIADLVAEKVAEGYKLTSDLPELKLAIDFSYALYSFGDVSGFPSTAPGSGDADDDASTMEEMEDEEAAVFPSLPDGFDVSLACASNDLDLCNAALLPLTTYNSQVGAESNELQFIEQRHMDAFRMTVDRMKTRNKQIHGDLEPPRRKLQWGDMQALYVLEKCLLEAMAEQSAEEYVNNMAQHFTMPCEVFDHAIFHSCLESLSFEDFPLDNELVAKHERAFLEEATSEFPAGNHHKDKKEEQEVEKLVLPIDEHKDDILHTVKTQRVTIIHGETGCGKSSRVPCFLLRADPPQPTSRAPEVKMIVSQPRRIAAKALAERVRSFEPDLADKIALRMGHGLREHETSKTRAWFVTTGYVVRLLANHPGWFDSHTHLIIDEVHERSIDTDILCLLCRRLLQSHPTIRLVLMSATMAAELYSQYFGSPEPPIHVGARRFPIKEYFVEDLALHLSLPPKIAKLARDTYDACEKSKCQSAPSTANVEKLHQLATQITASVGGHGSSVLIFVPGMSDIESIVELVEKLNRTGVTFICLPIHSDIPFEEQMAAFEPPGVGEVKVIIATNAAESSLTLPDVDHVICLGLCKQIVYNQASHRQMLVPTWISRASATQRAGRTGRVREGNVYRLYSRNTFHQYMEPFEQGELVRSPLDNTILSLRDMLNEAVTPILLECLEPPDTSTIERSFQSLHASNFISDPTDEGDITSLGSLVVALGIDLTLGAFVGLGIQFGVAAEAIQLAAILSFPKSPWAISSPLYHDTTTFNEIVSRTFISRCFFDAGLYSEPLAISNLLHDYSNCKDKNRFCWKNRVSASRVRHLFGTVESLKRRVAERLNVSTEVLEMNDPPYKMHHAKLNILRILQAWIFNDTIIVHNPSKSKIEPVGGSISIELDGPPIRRDHLKQILDDQRHNFTISMNGKLVQGGHFGSTLAKYEERIDFFDSFEIRFVSYMLENNIDLSFFFVGNALKLFVPSDIWDLPESSKLRESIISSIPVEVNVVCYVQNTGGGNLRGRRGRACGAWHSSQFDNVLVRDGHVPSKHVSVISSYLTKAQVKEFKRHMDRNVTNKVDSIKSVLSCSITETKKKTSYSIAHSGDCHQISKIDLCDLFVAPDLVENMTSSSMSQTVNFPCAKSSVEGDESSNDFPLIEDAPEGARLMAVLASERRRNHFIRFCDGSEEGHVDVNLPKKFSINGNNKWKKKDGGGMVFVPENNVPVAAIPTSNPALELFCCCANTLDLRGGACRVEGITMLPPGRMFVGLAQLAFGINPRTGLSVDLVHESIQDEEEKKEMSEVNPAVQEALSWIHENDKHPSFHEQWRIEEALQFNSDCMTLGEKLECQPDKIQALCAIFDGLDGHEMTVWDGYDLNLQAAMAALKPKVTSEPSKILKKKPPSNNELIEVGTSVEEATEMMQPCLSKGSKGTKPNSKSQNELSHQTFACLSCNQLFTTWNKCIKHRDECCPGMRMNRKKAISLANELATKSDTPPSDTPLSKTKAKKARPKKSKQQPKEESLAPKTVWACPICKDPFDKEKKCTDHMARCLFGLVKGVKPKMMHMCEGCSQLFETVEECCDTSSHKKGCRRKNRKM